METDKKFSFSSCITLPLIDGICCMFIITRVNFYRNLSVHQQFSQGPLLVFWNSNYFPLNCLFIIPPRHFPALFLLPGLALSESLLSMALHVVLQHHFYKILDHFRSEKLPDSTQLHLYFKHHTHTQQNWKRSVRRRGSVWIEIDLINFQFN